ncbi:hypothetical protein KAR91_47920 [Candidatus Pacearchaeota archaeon]|nr:hypothetical protein [Candidatus Pacearchaeota archaeon]
MTDELDGFELIPSRRKGSSNVDNVNFAVYIDKHHGAQLNVKFGKNIIDKVAFDAGDRIELRYNIGKRQILLTQGDSGYKLRPDFSFRRGINKGWHQEPFPTKEMSSTSFEIISIDIGWIKIQLPMENEHD